MYKTSIEDSGSTQEHIRMKKMLNPNPKRRTEKVDIKRENKGL